MTTSEFLCLASQLSYADAVHLDQHPFKSTKPPFTKLLAIRSLTISARLYFGFKDEAPIQRWYSALDRTLILIHILKA